MKRLTKQQAYDALSKAGLAWDRKDPKHIIVWTTGYLTEACRKVERFLSSARMQPVEQAYDGTIGKTKTVYREAA